VPYLSPVLGQPYPPPPPVPARSTGQVWLWLSGLLALLVLGPFALAGGYLVGQNQPDDLSVDANWHAPAGANVSYERPPAAAASDTEWSAWATGAARATITAQGKALLAGDKTDYVAVADPSNTSLVKTLTTRYANLHAMGIAVWNQFLGALKPAGGAHTWNAQLVIDYCFGDPSCAKAEVTEQTRWTVLGDRLVLSKLDAATSDDFGPRPWETDDLTVKAGKRVVVAATQSNAWRIPEALTIAEKAAAISDTFAVRQPPPTRYLIFFAGPNDWRRWYGMDEPDWAAAWSVPIATSVTDIVVRSDVVAQADLTVLLTHEMTHVTTLAGPRRGATQDAWWLIEGIAEYASHLNINFADYDGVSQTRQFVRTTWDGDPAVSPPGQSASTTEAAGKYGVAYLSVRRMAERYGKQKMLDFWAKIVHDADPIDSAARSVYGVPWSTVRADCAAYVRNQVNAL
jgi:hypothetical protein